MKNWHYALAVFLGGCCFGLLATFVKLAYDAGFSAAQVVGSQFTFGVILIWIAALLTKKHSITFKQASKIIIAGIPMGLTGTCYYLALQTLDASLAIIFLFQFIWIGSLLEWIMYKRRPTKGKIVSIIILLSGSILASGFITTSKTIPPWEGIVWGMLSAFTFSAFIFISGSVAKQLPPLQKSALLATGGWLMACLIFPPTFLFDLSILTGVAKYGLFLGMFGVFLPPLLFSIGMPHVGPGLGTILSASELPVALLMSALVLTELVTGLQWFGALLILGGIVLGNASFERNKLDSVRSTT